MRLKCVLIADAKLIARAKLNIRSEFSCGSVGTFHSTQMFNPHSMEENDMKKLGYVIAALGAIAVAAPSIASAQDVVIKHRDHDRYSDHDRFGARAEVREHRDHGWHEGWRHHGDKVVIIKHRHHEY
jgi:hypothetical protein